MHVYVIRRFEFLGAGEIESQLEYVKILDSELGYSEMICPSLKFLILIELIYGNNSLGQMYVRNSKLVILIELVTT